jgi:hypothetical protein
LKREHRHERHVALVARLALPAEPRPVPHARDAAGQVDAVGPPQVAQLARSYAGQQPREQRQLPPSQAFRNTRSWSAVNSATGRACSTGM